MTSSSSSSDLGSTVSFFFSMEDDLGSEYSDLDEAAQGARTTSLPAFSDIHS